MMQPMATSASKSSWSAIAFSAIGTSSAPGTVTSVMCLAETPSASSSAWQTSAMRDVIASLNRARTMPITRSWPSRSIGVP